MLSDIDQSVLKRFSKVRVNTIKISHSPKHDNIGLVFRTGYMIDSLSYLKLYIAT